MLVFVTFTTDCYVPLNDNEFTKPDTCKTISWTDVVTAYWTCDQLMTSSNLDELDWPSDVITCSNLPDKPIIKEEPQKFQKVSDRPVFVFSAYHEKREKAFGPSVRVIAAGFQRQFNEIGDFFCQLWFFDKRTPLVVNGTYEVIYRSIGHGDMWTIHYITCPLPSQEEIPYAVSVTPEECVKPINLLLVLNREPPKPTRTFGVCISAIYGGYRDWQGIIEMFEFYRIFGASEIVVYNLSLSLESNKALTYYKNKMGRNVTVVDWKIPREMHKTSTYFQRGVLNDCLHRLSHRHMFVAMKDLDEIMVPRKYKSWHKLFDDIFHQNTAIYMFQHSYFRRNTSDIEPYSIAMSSQWTTKQVFPAGKVRCKSMYNALLTYSVDVHYHYTLLRGTQEHMVDPSDALLHHYRISPMESFRKDPSIEFIQDKYLEEEIGDKFWPDFKACIEQIRNYIRIHKQ